MTNFLKYALFSALALSVSSQAHAHDGHNPKNNQPDCPNTAPEVDPSMAIGGLTLLGGTLAVVRARRTRKTQ